MPLERRRFLRTTLLRPVPCHVRFQSTLQGNPRESSVAALEVSRGGLRLAVPGKLPPGAVFQVWLTPPGHARDYHLAGIVRWCRERQVNSEIGVQLTHAPKTDYDAWQRLCFV